VVVVKARYDFVVAVILLPGGSNSVSVVGAKGQVVINKEIRDRLGVEPGWTSIQRLVGDHVELYFLPPAHRKSLKGMLRPYVRESIPREKWQEAREAAWDRAMADRERDTPDNE
jgi:bifunctional DNA-binding transcriptional regulator/antitoxin component of YhaV-PrlF toxin-antitoxin module